MGRFMKWCALALALLLVAGGKLLASQPLQSVPPTPIGTIVSNHTKDVSVAIGARPAKAHLAATPPGKSRKVVRAVSGSRRRLQLSSRARPMAVHPLVTTPSPSGCASGSGLPAPVATLVSALKCDPDLIYEYVYNNIEFEPLYGSNKGTLGTLLDRRGDDADQVQLLVALWNAAGYSQTGYVAETPMLSGTQVANWLGVPNDCTAILNLLTDGGYYSVNESCSGGTVTYITVNHFIAALCLGSTGPACYMGTWYYFDPSLKSHTILAGVTGLANNVFQYSRTQFLADAGGTIPLNGYSISNINRAQLRADLTGYATNLVNYVNLNNRALTVGNIIGGKTILPLTGSPIRVTGAAPPYSTFPADCPGQPTIECRTYFTITMPGGAGLAIKLYTDTVYGHRITVSSIPSSGGYVPTLLIDGVAPSCVVLGTCTNVGTAEPFGTNWPLAVQVVQANQGGQSKTLNIAAGGSYLISLGVGQVNRNMAEYHRQLSAQASAAGNAPSSEIVIGESLAAISYNWLAECSNEQQITDQFAQATTLYKIAVGITAQANIPQTNYTGPYVDLPLNIATVTPRVSGGTTIPINGFNYSPANLSVTLTASATLSAFESAVLQQTQAPVSNMTAASTAMLVDANMNPGYSGSSGLTYYADGTTTQGQSYFTNTILNNITYNSADIVAIQNAVTPSGGGFGQQVLIPQNGKLAVGSWNGAGYAEINFTGTNAITAAQLISGNLSGGATGVPISDDVISPNVQSTLFLPSDSFADVDTVSVPSVSDFSVAEPVDGVTGAYIYTHDDLVSGGNGFPYALPFSRTYLSSSGSYLTTKTADIGMGNGWADTYSINAQVESDPYIAMGASDTPAISAATSLAALYVMQDLFSIAPTAQTMTVSSMVARWFSDQLTNNAVFVTQPRTTEEYIALPHADGSTSFSFNPPPGSSVRFSQTAPGTFTYEQKNGVTLNFGPTPSGALQSWVFPNGVNVNLTYTGANLHEVTNNLGRSLTLFYTGSNVTSVEDDSGRSIGYHYDTNNNLTSFTDPLGNVTKFAYDMTGVYDTMGHLTQVFYPTNPTTAFVTNTYDALGRVAFQANANGDVSDFYIAGSRSEIDDALGNCNVTYQTDLGRVIMNAWVLTNPPCGDVFNDTPQQGGIVNIWTNQYDGIGRLTQSIAPEGDCIVYAYATSVNPWANNVASITRYAKPGTYSPCDSTHLASITQNFTYDPNWNKVATATDALGLVTLNEYNPATGNLTAATADYSASTGHFNAASIFTYNSVGQVLTAIDPVGTETANTYDTFGNLKTITRDYGGSNHLNQLTSLGYDSYGDVNSVEDPNTNITTSMYYANRLLESVTLPIEPPQTAPLVTTYTYNQDGKLIETQQTLNGTVERTTTTGYGVTDKPWIATDADGNTSYFAYDADDRLSSTTDPVGNVTSFVYDAMSRKTEVFNLAIQSTPLQQIAYEPDGPVASLADADIGSTPPDCLLPQTTHTTCYSYDGFNRLSVTTYPAPSGGSTTTETYTYDADSNVQSKVTRRGDTLSFQYDTLNRRCSKAIATTPTSCSATSSGNPTVWYSYDLDNHLAIANDNSATVVIPTSAASYSTSITYDTVNNPATASWTPAPLQTFSSSASVTFQDVYDADGRRTNQTATNNSWLSYPAATASSLTYNVNALNQYTCIFSSTCSVTLLYDGNGNLTYDGTFTYGYDAESRLTSILNGATTVATYAYDSLDRRKSKTVGSATTNYVNDADNREVLEYNGSSGAQQNWYAYGLGANAVLNQMNVASNTRETMVPDIQGSMIATLDATSGALTNAGYQPFGENPSVTSGTFRYTGQRFDPETAGSASEPSGLYYYRARMYSPTWGRFLQTDPISYSGGMNLYAYVNNSPINWGDPYGLAQDSPQDTTGGINWGSAASYVGGTALIVAGGAIALGGAGLDATGVGAFLGIPMNVEGGAMAVSGAAIIATAQGAAVVVGTGVTLQGMNILYNEAGEPSPTDESSEGLYSGGSQEEYDQLVSEAQGAYPNKAGDIESHHITPQYLGGPANGPIVDLDAAYHQQITNAFRQAYPYGQPPPDATTLQSIMQDVYNQYPLPPGTQ
jgi:RHS repeat-associated protein